MNLAGCRIANNKITGYLLNDDHEDGGPKSRFFKAFGFTADGWRRLQAALLEHPARHPVRKIATTVYGTKYEVVGDLQTPDGRNPRVVTVWQRNGGVGDPVLVTAYPD